tara:strand:- start:70 stop:1116 length:1047 start_codon:yes stop_codon:yes gene_type:complete
MTVRFGILGLGRVVKSRVCNVFKKEVKGAQVVSVYDKDKKKNLKFSKYFKVKPSKSFKDFLNKKFDYVYIATESGNHARNIKSCLDQGKNVIVEKPPTLRIDQLIKLDNLAKKRKLNFFVVYQNRLNKSVVFLKKILNKKLKKKIIFINLKLLWCRKQSYYNDWHGKWLYDGGVLAQQGIHYIDLLCDLFGKPISCISKIYKKSNNLQAEDTHIALVNFKNNITSQISLTTALRPSDIEASIEINTKDQQIKLFGLCCNKISMTQNKNKKIKILKKFSENVPTGYGLSHRRVIQNVINFKKNNNKKLKPLKAIETINTLKLVNMLYKSYEKNRWVFFNEKNLKSKLGF